MALFERKTYNILISNNQGEIKVNTGKNGEPLVAQTGRKKKRVRKLLLPKPETHGDGRWYPATGNYDR